MVNVACDPVSAEEYEEASALVSAGDPVAALRRLAALVERAPADPRGYREASRALFAALADPAALAAWQGEDKARLYRRLLVQDACAERPLILAHDAAARLTSSDPSSVARLVDELAPVLLPLARMEPVERTLVPFLLVVREQLGERIVQTDLSALHRRAFPEFSPDDLALPYSALFYPEAFGRNRADVLGWAGDPGFVDRLAPHHLLLVEWLGRTLPDRALLERVVRGHPDAPAAKSLVLRHDLPVGSADVRALAETLSLARAELPHGAATAAAERLRSRGWMAAHAARNHAAGYLPLLARGQRRVRVAVCVSGQLRGFRQVLPGWRRSLFAHADCTFFVHSWAEIGRSGAQPSRTVLPFAGSRFPDAYRRLGLQEGFPAVQQRYPSLFARLRDGARVTATEVGAIYDTPYVEIDDEADDAFRGFDNQQKMHYKIWAAGQLMMAGGGRFDLVVRIRPDLAIRNAGFDWRDMARAAAERPLVFTERPYGVHYGNLMIGDQFAVGSPDAMARYASAWQLYPQLAREGLTGCPPEFTGHVSLAQACWMHGLETVKAPIRFGRLHEPERLASAAILAALEEDAAARMDAIDRELIAAVRADTGR